MQQVHVPIAVTVTQLALMGQVYQTNTLTVPIRSVCAVTASMQQTHTNHVHTRDVGSMTRQPTPVKT